MFKGSNYTQGPYLIIKFFVSEYVKFGAEVLLNIFLIIFLFLNNFISISYIENQSYDHFSKIFLNAFYIKEILKIRNKFSSL